jgi:hypothetical protein
MSGDRLSRSPGGFQVRHRSLGLYQGSTIELAFWHPSSGMPEYGLYRFSTEEEAQSLIGFLVSPACAEALDREDLQIEPFDLTEHERLIAEYPLPSAWEQPL